MIVLITSVLNCASERLAISSLLSCIFFWSFEVFCHLGHFVFCLGASVTLKGWSLRCSLGWGKAGRCTVMLYMGEGLRGSNGTRSTLCRISVTPSTTHSRPLWVSPTTSPVKLGVSPATAPTPTGVFTQRFEAVSYTHLTLPTTRTSCRSRWSPYH